MSVAARVHRAEGGRLMCPKKKKTPICYTVVLTAVEAKCSLQEDSVGVSPTGRVCMSRTKEAASVAHGTIAARWTWVFATHSIIGSTRRGAVSFVHLQLGLFNFHSLGQSVVDWTFLGARRTEFELFTLTAPCPLD